MADPTLLWNPIQDNMETATAWTNWQNGRRWEFPGLNLPLHIVNVPGSVDWNANPYNNNTWVNYYHNLAWLLGISYGLNTGASASTYKPIVKDYLMDWVANATEALVPISWNEGAIPRRVAIMAYMYWKHLQGTIYISGAEETTLETSMGLQADALSALIDDPQFADDNHGFMHRLGLYNTCVAFPGIPNAATLQTKARDNIISSIPLLFHTDGPVVEQATAYHFIDADFVLEGIELLDNFGEPLSSNPTINALLDNVTNFAALHALPNDKLPAIGDTPIGNNYPRSTTNALIAAGYGDTIAVYANNRGLSGTKPDGFYLWSEGGYALFRPEWNPGKWRDDFQMFVGCWKGKVSHGHYTPAGHLVIYRGGESLIEDSGGPFTYSSPAGARYFIEPSGHNQCIPVGASFDPFEGATEVLSGDSLNCSYLKVTTEAWAGSTVTRMIVVDKNTFTVVVLDDVVNDTLRDNDLLWHTNKTATISSFGVGGFRRLVTGLRMKTVVDVLDSYGVTIIGIDDSEGNALQGWSTSSFLNRDRTPVIKYTKRGYTASFVTVIQSLFPEQNPESVNVFNNTPDTVIEVGKRSFIINDNGASILTGEL